MATLIVNDNGSRIQYLAAASETSFVFPFAIFEDGDLQVYQTPVGDTFDPINDLLSLNVDYTVTILAPPSNGGNITLIVGATLNDLITINRAVPATQDVDYTVGGNFTGESINCVINKLTILNQQVEDLITNRGLTYDAGIQLKANRGDNNLPQLLANQFWRMDPLGQGILATTLEEPADTSALRSDLANELNGTDGARLVGYYDSLQGSMTVKTKLDNITTDFASFPRKNLIIGGDFSLNPWQRGIAFVGVAANVYTADRFSWREGGTITAVIDINKIADAPTVSQAGIFTQDCLAMTVTTAQGSIAAGDLATHQYIIEGYDWSRIAQRTFTLSFWVYSFQTGTFAVTLQNAGQDRSYVAEYNVNASNTWEKKTIVVVASPSAGTWDYTSGKGLTISFIQAVGTTFHTVSPESWQTGNFFGTASTVNNLDSTSNTFRVDFVQAEEGNIASGFEIRHRTDELVLSQRYYFKTYDRGIFPGGLSTNGEVSTMSAGTASGDVFVTVHYPVPMRTIPTISTFNPGTGAPTQWLDGGGGAAGTQLSGFGQRAVSITNAFAVADSLVHSTHVIGDAEL